MESSLNLGGSNSKPTDVETQLDLQFFVINISKITFFHDNDLDFIFYDTNHYQVKIQYKTNKVAYSNILTS